MQQQQENQEKGLTGLTFEQLKNISPQEQKKLIGEIKALRGRAKKVNFAGIYGAGAPKIAITAGITLNEAKVLHTTYWKRNKSVKQVSAACTVKRLYNQAWLWNPVSMFWYSLREEKDKFSTLNQGTGVYCFDTWVRKVRSRNIRIGMQYHDEISFPLYEKDKQGVKEILDWAIHESNEELKLNIKLGISVDFGPNYSSIH